MEKRDWRARKERVMERVGCKGKADESGNNGAKVRGVEREDKKTGGQNRQMEKGGGGGMAGNGEVEEVWECRGQ